jgi:hypothetical protein
MNTEPRNHYTSASLELLVESFYSKRTVGERATIYNEIARALGDELQVTWGDGTAVVLITRETLREALLLSDIPDWRGLWDAVLNHLHLHGAQFIEVT